MQRASPSIVFLSIMMICALTFGGVMHSVIPHTHGDDAHSYEEKTENPQWTSLHSALRHEDKKLLQLLLMLLWSVMLLADFLVVQRWSIVLKPIPVYATDHVRGEYLRRGIARYRRFG